MAEGKTFLEFVRAQRPFIPNEFGFNDTSVLKETGENVFVWRLGKPKEDRFDFSPFFPFDNGGTPPFFMRRSRVSRDEAGMYFRYRAKCRREGWEIGGFEPYPLPTPEDLKELQED